jgi:putative transposase
VHGTVEQKQLLSAWPLPRPRQWIEQVNRAQSAAELSAIQRCVVRGQPLGSAPWIAQTALDLGLQSTLRPRGRPRKPDSESDAR